MRSLNLSVLVSIVMCFAATSARAQCSDWRAGPLFEGGSSDNGTNGSVYAITSWDPDRSGPRPAALVVAGVFTSIAGVAVSNIALRDPITGQWEPLGGATNDAVLSLAVYDDELIASGGFTVIGGASSNHIARWNGFNWQPLGVGLDGAARALVVHDNALVAGGFSSGPYVQRWAGSSWEAMGGEFGGSGGVNALTVHDGELIVAGSVDLIFDPDRREIGHVARWTGSSWQPVGDPPGNTITSLVSYNGDLIAGGEIIGDDSGPFLTGCIGRWDGTAWQSMGSGVSDSPVPNEGVFALEVYSGALFAGGWFREAGGQPASHIALWDGSAWRAVGGGIDWVVGTLAAYDGELIAGGSFASAGGTPANDIAHWDGVEWRPFGGGTVDRVHAFTNFGSRIVAGGQFNQPAVLGGTARNIVAWDGVQLSAFGTGMNNQVNALMTFTNPGLLGSTELIAGGAFTVASGNPANFIARWVQGVDIPRPRWSAMGAGFNDAVTAIERFNGETYAAGMFTSCGSLGDPCGIVLNHVARWDGDSWEPLGTGTNGQVLALKAYSGVLYAGGAFTKAGGVTTGGLAYWNGSSWRKVGGQDRSIPTLGGTVHALEVYNGQLVIGGQFPGVGNIATFNDLTHYTALGGGTNATVRSLRSSGGRLYAGGDFNIAGGVSVNRFASWDGTWHAGPGGPDAGVYALAAYHDEIHAGGTFESLCGATLVSPGWSRYLVTGIPWIAYPPGSQALDAGEDALFLAEPADGYEPLAYQWYRDTLPLSEGPTGTGSTLIGATSSKHLRVLNVSSADVGGYTLVVSNASGSVTSSIATLTVNGPVDVTPRGTQVANAIEALGPNPSGGATRLGFALAREGRVSVRVYDVGGRLVRGLELGALPAGHHQAAWDGRGNDGSALRAGLYFLALEVDRLRFGVRRLVIQR